MIQDFLSQYEHASSPEDERYDQFFPQGIKRADFMLFSGQIICEAKILENTVVKPRIERLVAKGRTSGSNFSRDVYAPINKQLSKANKQILATKEALSYPDALGLILIENTVENDYSILSLMSAANRKMLSGLDNVDGVLCIDHTNFFSNEEGERVRPIQLILRETERSDRLSQLMDKVMTDYGEHLGVVLPRDFSIEEGGETWVVDREGKYKKREGQVRCTYPVRKEEIKPTVREKIATALNRWLWVPAAMSLAYDWLSSL